MDMPVHARGRYILQDDAAFYRITSISFFHVIVNVFNSNLKSSVVCHDIDQLVLSCLTEIFE